MLVSHLLGQVSRLSDFVMFLANLLINSSSPCRAASRASLDLVTVAAWESWHGYCVSEHRWSVCLSSLILWLDPTLPPAVAHDLRLFHLLCRDLDLLPAVVCDLILPPAVV